jgi:hypothetical protein
MNQNIEHILNQIKKLDFESNLYLIQKMVDDLKLKIQTGNGGAHRLSELNSLGSDVWKDIDLEQYIQQERSWD